jgi:preprotein translocase subunit SecE
MAEQALAERVKGWPQTVRDYFQNLRLEMRRVTWPSKKQVQATTGIVILAVFAFAAYFAVVDAILSQTITKLYEVLTK